ncbi:hypothetical protein HZS_2318 [Henneguya salminicola]|nr:hypothetical protein HZS_2318 [Henneguya salminicola]
MGFSYTLKRIHKVPERGNMSEILDSRLQYALRYINLSSRFSENEIVGFNFSLRCCMGRSLGGTSVPAI